MRVYYVVFLIIIQRIHRLLFFSAQVYLGEALTHTSHTLNGPDGCALQPHVGGCKATNGFSNRRNLQFRCAVMAAQLAALARTTSWSYCGLSCRLTQ